jgi:outer membrane receptor protein involved in Fe transport
VEPLLTPRFMTFERATFEATHALTLAVETRYTSRSFLQNTGDARYLLPAAFDLSANAAVRIRSVEVLVRANNLTDSKKYGSGYASDGVSYYYVLPPRNVFVSLKIDF